MELGITYSRYLVENERPQASKSSETSESIVKLAKESLEVGKILRIIVISNEEATLGRIKTDLKKGRKVLANQRATDFLWYQNIES